MFVEDNTYRKELRKKLAENFKKKHKGLRQKGAGSSTEKSVKTRSCWKEKEVEKIVLKCMDNAEKISDEENSEMDEACFFMVELALLDEISHETGELHQTLCALLQFLDKSTLPVQVKISVTCSLVTRLRAILKVHCKKIKFDVSCTCVQ